METWQKLGLGAIVLFIVSIVTGATAYNQGQAVITKGNLDDGVYFFMVSHTEYKSDETGQIIARLVNWQGDPIDASCVGSIKYPDKTAFITNQSMSDSTIAGDHYLNFTTPSIEGIYEYQSVCNYTIGASPRSSSATNSFHLSPALNIIDVINATTLEINGTTYNILDDVRAINITRTAFLEAMNLSVDTDLQTIIDNLDAVNLSLDTDLAEILTTILAVNLSVDTDLAQIYTDLLAINVSLANDVSNVYTDTQYIRTNMLLDADFQSNMTQINTRLNEISDNLTAIEGFCDDAVTNNSQLCVWVDYIRNNLNAGNGTYQNLVEGYLAEINSTTHNTYDYLTGTVTTNLDILLSRTLGIENTVNATKITTEQINVTANTILDESHERVYLTVFS